MSAPPPPPKLLDRVRHAGRARHSSTGTDDAYHDWAGREGFGGQANVA